MDLMTLANDPTFWIYGGVFMLIGILIGWFFTRRGWRKRLNEAETRISDMQAAQRREQREQEDAVGQAKQLTAQVEQLQASLKSAEDELAAVRAESVEVVSEDEASDEATDEGGEPVVEEVEVEVIEMVDDADSDLRMQLSLLQEQYDAATQNAASELEQARTEAEMLAAARIALETELAAAREEAGVAREEVESLRAQMEEAGAGTQNKEIALNEAYEHAAAVQSQLKACQEEVAAARGDVKKMQTEVKALEATREELERRVQHSRSDVAGDLAVLTSTMLKIKDDALDEANARIAELTEEMERLRAQEE